MLGKSSAQQSALANVSPRFQNIIEYFQHASRTAGVRDVPFLPAPNSRGRFGGLGGFSDHRPRRSSGTGTAPSGWGDRL